MPNKNYIRGRSFEYRVEALLANEYDYYPIRTAGSHSICDIVAWNSIHCLFIQCKHTTKDNISLTGIVNDDNVKILEQMNVPYGSRKIIAIKQGRSNDILFLEYSRNGWILSKI